MTTEFERTLAELDELCRKHRVSYAVVGGIAAIIHGSFRVTGDIDLTVYAEIDELDSILRIFAQDYVCRHQDPLGFFQRCFFVPLRHGKTGVRIDVAAALSSYERQVIQRSQRAMFNTVEVSVCTVEDLIIMKLVASRPKDTADLHTIIPLKREHLNLAYLRARAREFIDVERSDVPERLEELLRTLK